MALAVALLALAGCVTPDPSTDSESTAAESPWAPRCEPMSPTFWEGDTNPGGSESNAPGSYSYSGQALAKSSTYDVRWTNPSPTSRISWDGQSATGNVRVSIFDACGKLLYDQSSGRGQGAGYQHLPLGHPGAWLIRLKFETFTGQMSLSVTS